MPVAVSGTMAALEGLGAQRQPFDSLDKAFKRDNGFEADISVRQVTQPQCPAITFLGRLRGERTPSPRLDIDKVNLRSGEALTGLVDRFGSRNIELLLVSDSGIVQNISSLLKSGTDAKTFSIVMQKLDGVSGSQPQLLVAIASTQPLAAVRPGQPVGADQFFASVMSEMGRSGQSITATARHFILER
jgi:hypothetical protein